jgi:hypothetical protein
MTAISNYRVATEVATPVPARGTYPSAANQLFYGLTLVSVDGDGNAVVPSDGDGFAVCGVANATYDNRTASEAGGDAGDLDIEVQFGVFGFNFTGTTPEPGQVLFVVDNQTVSVDSDSGQRGIAGYCVEVRANTGGTNQAFILVGPTVAGQIVIAAAEAADLDTAQEDIDELQADALTAQYCIPVPLNTFRIYADGEALIPFVDGTDGIDFTAESLGYRFNDDTTAKIAASVLLPNDLDDAAAIVVHVLGYRVGALDATAALTVGAFFRVAGAAFSADADAGGDTTAFDGATTVVTEETLSIAAGDVPASPSSLLLTLVPTAALDGDDLVILEVWLEVTRKLLTA